MNQGRSAPWGLLFLANIIEERMMMMTMMTILIVINHNKNKWSK